MRDIVIASAMDIDKYPKHRFRASARWDVYVVILFLLSLLNYLRSQVGLSVQGPGCSAPARFLDYSMYHKWITRTITRIGRPAITRIAPNRLIMRRTVTNIQRFGDCDSEEMDHVLYGDETIIDPSIRYKNQVRYNVMRLQGWGVKPNSICYSFEMLQIELYVVIDFNGPVKYSIRTYGNEIKMLDPLQLNAVDNQMYTKPSAIREVGNIILLYPQADTTLSSSRFHRTVFAHDVR
ncbi:hypothetical protein K1T71_012749 [Dendrolimus kikuchii]|uniref:Uncharacterized protein n=1 Tax=Dendrolimus kikuchii TaxID=765133 RepID=A0ACC1CKA8_9NEOP|nr:hypothetical protein K1T71_012749 [Dendrolimus kikuchii]